LWKPPSVRAYSNNLRLKVSDAVDRGMARWGIARQVVAQTRQALE
jgi:hypothetical protein